MVAKSFCFNTFFCHFDMVKWWPEFTISQFFFVIYACRNGGQNPPFHTFYFVIFACRNGGQNPSFLHVEMVDFGCHVYM